MTEAETRRLEQDQNGGEMTCPEKEKASVLNSQHQGLYWRVFIEDRRK